MQLYMVEKDVNLMMEYIVQGHSLKEERKVILLLGHALSCPLSLHFQ